MWQLKVLLATLSIVTADSSSQFNPPDGCHHFPHCVSCPLNENGVHSCTQCRKLYGLDNSQNPTPCVLCREMSGCHSCTTTTKCDLCVNRTLGPNLDGVGTCGRCAPGCIDCRQSGAGLCDKCGEGYFLDGKRCSPCFDNCRFCTGYNVCSMCDRGYYKSSDGTTCSACIANCDYCYEGKTCERCFPGYFLKTDTECAVCEQENCAECDRYKCRKCKNGKISANGSCKCSDNCLSCNTSGWGKCDDCMPGYKRTDDKLCVKPGNGNNQ